MGRAFHVHILMPVAGAGLEPATRHYERVEPEAQDDSSSETEAWRGSSAPAEAPREGNLSPVCEQHHAESRRECDVSSRWSTTLVQN